MEKSTVLQLPQRIIIALCFAFATALLVLLWFSPNAGYDWITSFAPAGRSWLHPYEVPRYHNPPWTALLLWPLAMLPLRAGYILNCLLNVGVVIWLVRRHKGSWLAILVTLLSPPFVSLWIVGNIEWLPMLAIVWESGWGVPLLLTKPQTGAFVALLYFKRARFNWRFLLPMAGVLVLSFVIWGWWPPAIRPLPEGFADWNRSIFPWGVPFGLVCAWLAWKRDDLGWALLASLLLTPYFGIVSLVPAVAVWSARHPRAVGLMVAAFWLFAALLLLIWI